MSVFRQTYRKLDEYEVAHVEAIKRAAERLYVELYAHNASHDTREIALAKTKLEECVMWAVKGVTG